VATGIRGHLHRCLIDPQMDINSLIAVDPKLTAEAVKEAVAVGQAWIGTFRHKRDRDAARLLHYSRLVVMSMAAYANECRMTYGPLLIYSEAWSPKKKAQAASALEHFLNVHEIYPVMGRALPSLHRYLQSQKSGNLRLIRRRLEGPRRRNDVEVIATAGQRYFNRVMTKILESKRGWLPKIENQKYLLGVDSSKVVSYATAILTPIHKPGEDLFDRANSAYGDLEDEILGRHLDLWKWRQISLGVSATPDTQRVNK